MDLSPTPSNNSHTEGAGNPGKDEENVLPINRNEKNSPIRKKITKGEMRKSEDKKEELSPRSGITTEFKQLHLKSKLKEAQEKRFKAYLSNESGSTEISSHPFKRFLNRELGANIRKKSHEPQLLVKLTTVMIANLYRQCNPKFKYKPSVRPRRALSKPCKGVSNSGRDNADSNLVMYANDILHSESGPFRSFRVEEMLGKGTFGQVVKAEDLATKKKVAVKVIKNKPAYYRQAIIEIKILNMLNQKFDPNDENNIVRLHDHFSFKNHLCLVFEMLSVNLYELIKQNRFRGLSCNLIRTILRQILRAMNVMANAGVIHCDLKPENILLSSLNSAKIKIIDFGSACDKNHTVYSYIQSRFYRSPEVLLGLPYDMKIDMWSIGCVAAELFLGLPLFPGVSAFNQIFRIVEMLGVPQRLCRRSKKASLFFDHDKMIDEYRIKSIARYADENKKTPVYPKRYFKHTRLDSLVYKYPYRTSLSAEEKEKEKESRGTFIAFISNLLRLDPEERATPMEALDHPFIVGENMAATAASPASRKNSHFSPEKRTLGFDVPPEQHTLTFERSAPVQLRQPFTSGFHHPPHPQSTVLQHQHQRQRQHQHQTGISSSSRNTAQWGHGLADNKLYDSPSRHHPRSKAIMIKTPSSDMSFSKEMADHTPMNHTPVLRETAHSHSLTLASTPMLARGSPVHLGGGGGGGGGGGLFSSGSHGRGMSPGGGSGLWGRSSSSLPRGSPAIGSPLRTSSLQGMSPIRRSSNSTAQEFSPFHVESPNRGGEGGAGAVWVPGPPQLRYPGRNSHVQQQQQQPVTPHYPYHHGTAFRIDSHHNSSPERSSVPRQHHPHSWGHNHHSQYLGGGGAPTIIGFNPPLQHHTISNNENNGHHSSAATGFSQIYHPLPPAPAAAAPLHDMKQQHRTRASRSMSSGNSKPLSFNANHIALSRGAQPPLQNYHGHLHHQHLHHHHHHPRRSSPKHYSPHSRQHMHHHHSHHQSPLKKFQPPLRNIMRKGGGGGGGGGPGGGHRKSAGAVNLTGAINEINVRKKAARSVDGREENQHQ